MAGWPPTDIDTYIETRAEDADGYALGTDDEWALRLGLHVENRLATGQSQVAPLADIAHGGFGVHIQCDDRAVG
jgi:hypothetical protein